MDEVIARLERLVGGQRLRSGEALHPYTHDESDVGPRQPLVAVEARSAEEVEAIVRLARETKTPVVPRGAGTGKSGGALAERGGIVLSTAGMTAIREIDRRDLVAVVEPGVVTKTLQDAVEAQNLFYPPDPSSLDTSTLGGNAAHDAGGPRALKYGVTRDYVLATETVLGTGERVRTGHRSIKGVAGYDLTALLVGSEGTLGIFTELSLQLLPKPERVETALLVYGGDEGEEQAIRSVDALFGSGLLPRTCELLDRPAMQAVRSRAPFAFPPDVAAALIVEVDGNEDGCARDLRTLEAVCTRAGAAEVLLAQTPGQRAKVWETRRLVSPSLRALRPFKMSEDVAVPRGRMLELVRAVRRLGQSLGLETAVYGHAGDGNLHVNLLFASRDDGAKVEAALAGVVAAAVQLGGTITGEHGVGLAKKRFLSLEQSPALVAAQRRIKAALDPDGILNPGKIFPDES